MLLGQLAAGDIFYFSYHLYYLGKPVPMLGSDSFSCLTVVDPNVVSSVVPQHIMFCMCLNAFLLNTIVKGAVFCNYIFLNRKITKMFVKCLL